MKSKKYLGIPWLYMWCNKVCPSLCVHVLVVIKIPSYKPSFKIMAQGGGGGGYCKAVGNGRIWKGVFYFMIYTLIHKIKRVLN